jgi:hypothetical protein
MSPLRPPQRPLDALNRVLGSVEAIRNGRALYALLTAFAAAGLLLAMTESALAREQVVWGAVWGGMALTALFYGTHTAGILLMHDARAVRGFGSLGGFGGSRAVAGAPSNPAAGADTTAPPAPLALAQAWRLALATGHRLLGIWLLLALVTAALLAAVAALLWTTKLPVIGPLLLALVLPLSVVAVGAALLAGVGVVAPLAAPAVWSGLPLRRTLALLMRHVRERLMFVALLVAAASGMAALVGAIVSFAVVGGGRVVSALAVVAAGVELPAQVLMAGLFGHGLRSLGAAGAPIGALPHVQAALTGGGVVFVLALVLPALVYLRGLCAVFAAVEPAPALDSGP